MCMCDEVGDSESDRLTDVEDAAIVRCCCAHQQQVHFKSGPQREVRRTAVEEC